MIVRDIAAVLKERRQATNDQLAVDIGADRKMVGEALRFWVERGDVRRVVDPGSGAHCDTHCRGCPLHGACSVGDGTSVREEVEVYEWIDVD